MVKVSLDEKELPRSINILNLKGNSCAEARFPEMKITDDFVSKRNGPTLDLGGRLQAKAPGAFVGSPLLRKD